MLFWRPQTSGMHYDFLLISGGYSPIPKSCSKAVAQETSATTDNINKSFVPCTSLGLGFIYPEKESIQSDESKSSIPILFVDCSSKNSCVTNTPPKSGIIFLIRLPKSSRNDCLVHSSRRHKSQESLRRKFLSVHSSKYNCASR